VPDSEREAIWNAFERGAAARETGAGGSGIGLSVVRDLVTHHGGRTWVEAMPAGGARFVVEFEAVALASPRTVQ
jgi:signal transduction histidine kinase